MPNALPFDRIIVGVGASRREMSLEEFMALPLHPRILLILSREIEFYSGEQLIDRRLALRRLRESERSV